MNINKLPWNEHGKSSNFYNVVEIFWQPISLVYQIPHSTLLLLLFDFELVRHTWPMESKLPGFGVMTRPRSLIIPLVQYSLCFPMFFLRTIHYDGRKGGRVCKTTAIAGMGHFVQLYLNTTRQDALNCWLFVPARKLAVVSRYGLRW